MKIGGLARTMDMFNNNEEINVLLLGASGVGKSHFVNKYLPGAARVFEGPQHKNHNLSRTTLELTYYRYNNHLLIDSPGMFDQFIDDYDKSCEQLENFLKQVNQVDYILLCISATKGSIRSVDYEIMRVVNTFNHLHNNLIIYITKMDLLDENEQRKFMSNYNNHHLFRGFKTFVPMGCINSSDVTSKTSILEYMSTKNKKTQRKILEESMYIPKINEIQAEMLNNNLYPPDYKKFNTGLNYKKMIIIFIIIVIIGGILTNPMIIPFALIICPIIFVVWYVDEETCNVPHNNVLNINLIKLNNVSKKYAPIRTIINYKSGKKFYEGTMYGNNFNQGIFYKETGEVLYEKIL